MLSTTGIRFRNRDYVAAWVKGLSGERVRVRSQGSDHTPEWMHE
ncbi:Mu transposase C-terminal domain-containing protein [Streptomyces yangpuensis]